LGPLNFTCAQISLPMLKNVSYLESQQGWPGATGDKFEKFSFLFFTQSSNDLPEDDDGRMGLCESVAIFRVHHLKV
jgi:hypothetical protein